MMAVIEALSSQGTVLGAVFTFVLYGVLPLGIVMYILGTPGRRRLRRAAEAATADVPGSAPPHGSNHAPGEAIASERKEP
jgi:hypothetical protein